MVSQCWKGTFEEYTLYLFGHKDKRQYSNSLCGVAIRFKDPVASFKSGRVTVSLLLCCHGMCQVSNCPDMWSWNTVRTIPAVFRLRKNYAKLSWDEISLEDAFNGLL